MLLKLWNQMPQDKGYRAILKQKIKDQEQLVKFTSGMWNETQKNYSTIK